MLNISDTPISTASFEEYPTFQQTRSAKSYRLFRWLLAFFSLFLIILFLPWTQNVRTKGKITTLTPDNRPQSVYATIGGRVEKWYVREGDVVRKGDTLAFLSEVKVDYMDTSLLLRTKEQIQAKNAAVQSYEGKAGALLSQIAALESARDFKISQTKNKISQYRYKIIADSTDWAASKLDAQIAEAQYIRTDSMYAKGIKSLTDLEEKRRKMQETQAKRTSYENKLLTTRAELLNAQIELNGIASEYADKIAKSQSDRFSTLSDKSDAQGTTSKLQSQYSSYQKRAEYYHIIAPQDGFVSKILKKGLGEIIKENDELLTIIPKTEDLAVEMYVRAMDYPLLAVGEKVSLVFDGFPAFVFSGWQAASYGTFWGKISVVDNIANELGMYRVLVSPDPTQRPWGAALRVGAGAEGMIMLNDVCVWYELWRQLNGFPPEFYEVDAPDKVKNKAPINTLKK